MNLIGVVLGSLFSLIYHVPWMILIFAGAPLLLWVYSIRLKHKLLVGNLAVSILTGTVPVLVILFEYPLLARNFSDFPEFFPAGINALLFWVGSFGFFAFMTNLIREIIKDAEDVSGDKESGSNTLPICYGYRATKIVIIALSVLTVLSLGFFFLRYLTDWISLIYFLVCLVLPFLILVWKTIKASSPKDYHFISQLSKIIMLLGLLYAPVAHFIISYLSGS
jgi:4-hydroxybenzoate polyprenyltransferase